MQTKQRSVFLQSLRGNQAVVVLAFLLARRALTIEELEEETGLSNDTVRKAVRGLEAKDMIHMQRGERGKQTWLASSETFFDELPVQNPKFSDSGSSSPLLNSSLPLEEEEEVLRAESDIFRFCLKACDEVGIREPKRRQIAMLEHVTPDFIRRHAEWALGDGHVIGTAIFRIINNWPVPEGESGDIVSTVDRGRRGQETFKIPGDIVDEVAAFTGHRRDCKCMDCTVAKFQGISALCPECRKYRCECEEE